MILLNTIEKQNSLVAHALDYVVVYTAPTISLYRKTPNTNDLSLVKTFELAGVLRLAISEDGQKIVAQTATQTYRLHMPTDDPLVTTGAMGISNTNHLIVLQPTAVQVIRETTVLLTATLSTADRVACGDKAFIVYNTTRYLRGTYTGVVLTPTTPSGKTIRFVSHTGGDVFAIFYSDGTVEINGNVRTLRTLRQHRESGMHVVANDGTDEYAYIKRRPLTDPVKVRTYVEPPFPADFFTTDTGGAPLTYTVQKTADVFEDIPAQIGAVSYTFPHKKQDSITILLDQPVDLSATDWTLEWTSLNQTAADGDYYAEIAMLPAANGLGVTVRYGDTGFGNRLQFGGLLNAVSNAWNINFTKATLNGVLKKCALVKQGTSITVYINDIRRNLAVGTGSTYNLTTFPVDANITAIKRIILGPGSQNTMGAIRGPVKLSLSAKRPPVFTLMDTNGGLNPSITNVGGVTVAPNLLTFSNGKYLTMPTDAAFAPGTKDFEIEMEVYFTSMPAAVSGYVLQPLMFWGTFATTGQPINFDICYIHSIGNPRLTIGTRYDASVTHNMTYETPMAVGQWYSLKWKRVSGVLKLYMNGAEVMSQDYPHDIGYDTAQPVNIGRRLAGGAGEVIWYANMQMRKFAIKIS